MSTASYRRVLDELCEIAGVNGAEELMEGGKVRIDGYLFSLFYEETLSETQMFVYADLGPAVPEVDDVYEKLLKINFKLGAGTGSMMSMHPESKHIFFSFTYTLDDAASGRKLLDSMLFFLDGLDLEELEISDPQNQTTKQISNWARV